MVFPSLGVIDLAHGAQIERIRDERVERVCRNRDYLAETDGGLRAVQCFRRRRFGINLYEIGGHAVKRSTI